MYKNIADNLANLLSANKIIDINNQEAYSYGLELFLFKFTLYIIILIISLLTGSFIISLVFTASYMLLRQYTGGYHCKTSEACMLTSILIYTFMLLLYNLKLNNLTLFFFVIIPISYLIIILKAPIENENNPLDTDETKKYRILSIIISTLLTVLSIITFIFDFKQFAFPIAYTLTADAVLLLISPRRNKNEENNS